MRFERQLDLLKPKGQEMLSNATVAVVGAGGLGCVVLSYLACAGVKKIIAIDCDTVQEGNLNRQFLYGYNDINLQKAEQAATHINQAYDSKTVFAICERLTETNAAKLIGTADIVVDCVDNINTRKIVGAYALDNSLTLVEGGVGGFGGFVMSVKRGYACLECVIAPVMISERATSVVGATVGVIGSLQASECIKHITKKGKPLLNRMLIYDGLNTNFNIIDLSQNERCRCHQYN